MAIKECVVCGGEFEANAHNQTHCSVDCRNQKYNEARRRTGRVLRRRPCVVCAKEFTATGHGSGHVNTCSDACRKTRKKQVRLKWESQSQKLENLRLRYRSEGRLAEYSRKSRLRNLDRARERERQYAQDARMALKLVRELQSKGLEALL